MYDNVISVLHNRWIQALGALVVLVLVLFLIYLVSPLLTPVFLALLAAYLLNPVVDVLSRRLKLKRFYVASALMFLSILVAILLPVVLLPMILREAESMIKQGSAKPDETVLEWLPMKEFVLMMNWDPHAPAPAVGVPTEVEVQVPAMTVEGSADEAKPASPPTEVKVSVETEAASPAPPSPTLTYDTRAALLTESARFSLSW
jgi:hypothetical protein